MLKRASLLCFLGLLLVALLAACSRSPQTTPATTEAGSATIVTTHAATRVAASTPTGDTPAATATAARDETFLPFTSNGPEPTPTPQPTETTTPTPAITPSPSPPPYPTYEGPPVARSDFGIQIHLHRESLDEIFKHLERLGVGWVKVQVSWKLYEPAPGEYDEWRFQELDHLVSGAAGRDINVLIGVAKAPEWSRATSEEDGPPQDPARFQEFMAYLAWRYQGNLAAYELWNEPNLQREWHGAPLDPAALVELIEYGAAGVRAEDPQALLVSAAPATTGINDGVTAIDDRAYFRGMLDAGVGDVVDAIGVHPYGWANPPLASASDIEQAAPSHNNHRSFFFGDTLREYRALLDDAGHADLPLWLTEFGWGSFEGMGAAPPPGAEFMAYVNEWQQAQYTLHAYALAQQWPNVGPLFLWNLNFAPTLGAGFSESGYSVLRPDGTPRPVYFALRTMMGG
ncbi:MAG TPA: cellulase family glycosylhydrolase [Candidatus Sulfomarinibacteraceae bacterium]|nr:cellulase family glycosylhydrolase [Candidatus Sulfomarinibacteraceae bacterium]